MTKAKREMFGISTIIDSKYFNTFTQQGQKVQSDKSVESYNVTKDFCFK